MRPFVRGNKVCLVDDRSISARVFAARCIRLLFSVFVSPARRVSYGVYEHPSDIDGRDACSAGLQGKQPSFKLINQ